MKEWLLSNALSLITALFGGGFSVSHYMLMHRSKSYKHFHYNELRPGLCELIQGAINGKYNYDIFKPEWITREKFLREKELSAYIKIIWSFSNDGESYIFGKEIENEKNRQTEMLEEGFHKKTKPWQRNILTIIYYGVTKRYSVEHQFQTNPSGKVFLFFNDQEIKINLRWEF